MLKHGILGLLSFGDSSGYDISLSFSDGLSYFWMANQSQIYRELNNMEKISWVRSYKEPQESRPDRRVYSLTAEGKEELLNWLKDDGVENLLTMRCPILMKIFFSGAIDKREVEHLLKNFKLKCIERASSVSQIQEELDTGESGNTPPYWRYTTDYCKGYYDFLINWVDDTLADLRRYK